MLHTKSPQQYPLETKTKTQKVNSILEEAKVRVAGVIERFQTGQLEAQPGRTMMEAFEANVNGILNKARDDAGKAAQSSVNWNNNIVRMVNAGSKGSFINISQMMACVGQQNVEGKRIPFGFVDRTLPHFLKDDYGPESRGFVENSYLRGLTPQEFFFHAMGGREGLIDTAVKTSSTGYIQRRLVKAMEDLVIRYDGTVRNAGGAVVQFLYGEDGMDGTRVEEQHYRHAQAKEGDLRRTFEYVELEAGGPPPNWLSAAQAEELRTDLSARCGVGFPFLEGGGAAGVFFLGVCGEGGRELSPFCFSFSSHHIPHPTPKTKKNPTKTHSALLDEELAAIRDDLKVMRAEVLRAGDSKLNIPVHMERLVWTAQTKFDCGPLRPPKPGGLSPLDVVRAVRELSEKLVVVVGRDGLSTEAQRNATVTFMALLRASLASKRVLKEYRLNADAFGWMVGEIERRFNLALANCGEAIGTVAAQSIGEPTTQMTLNTFHFAGVSAKNVTLGVPRLTEIINLAKNIKTPSLTVYLTGEHAKDRDMAKAVQCKLEYATLRSVVARSEVWYDPIDMGDPTATVVPGDAAVLEYAYGLDVPEELVRAAPWLLRLEFDASMMVDKKLEMDAIEARIRDEFQDVLTVAASDNNARPLVARLRILEDGPVNMVGGGGGGGGGGEGDDDMPELGDGGAAASATDETMRRLDATYLRDLALQVCVYVWGGL
jgi:DNA-directed RNA polymerase II subunit RPB1